MLENLFNLVKQQAGDAIINNPAIPNQKNDEAVQAAGSSIEDTLKNALAGGQLNDVMRLFANGQATADQPVVQQATGNFMEKLQSQFGLNGSQAAGIANNLIPNVMNQLAQKTANPADNSFNVQEIFNQLSGGKTSGMNIQGMLNKLKGGLDSDHDGDVDLQDLKAMFSGGGSVVDKLKGFLG
ncbi:MAG TPA: hypothetical protein VIM79_19875 [Niastella sp.]